MGNKQEQSKERRPRINRRSTLLVYLVSNFLLLILPAVILTINTRVTYRFQTQMLAQSRQQLAEQFQQVMDNELDEMDKLYRGMFTDEEVVRFMFVKDGSIQNNDYYTVLQIVNKLSLIYNTQSSITGIYLYFPASSSIITPTYRLHARTFFDRILELEDVSYEQWVQLLRKGYITLSNVLLENDAEYLYFARTLYITTDEQYTPVFFFSIEKDSIRQKAQDLLGSAQMSVEIIDVRDGTSVFDTGIEENSPYIELPSSIEDLHYRIYYPANNFTDEYIFSLRVILISTILGFLINIGIAIYLAYRNYQPIRRTLTYFGRQDYELRKDENEFDQIQAIMDRTFARNAEMKPIYQQYYLHQLLEGRIRMTQPVLENVAASGIDLSSGWFQLFEIIPTEEKDNKTDLTDTIQKLMNENLDQTPDTYYVPHENIGLTLLKRYSDKPDNSMILSGTEMLQRKTENILSQPIAIYVSRILDQASDLPTIYQQAERARIYVGWSGYTGILTYEDFMNEQIGIFRYSIDDELQLINYIRSGETEKVSEEIDRLFYQSTIRTTEDDPQITAAIRSLMIHLLSTYLKVSQQLGLEEESVNYDIIRTASIQQTRVWCMQAFCGLADRAKEKYDKNSKAVHQVQAYITEHYADDNLGLAGLADVAGLSASYLSTLFKQNTGMNLSDSINRVRIDHAKEKLKSKDQMTIHEIAVACGFFSDATFMRVFKKLEGITPGEFRRSSEIAAKHDI